MSTRRVSIKQQVWELFFGGRRSDPEIGFSATFPLLDGMP
jgi:hypothetical protein